MPKRTRSVKKNQRTLIHLLIQHKIIAPLTFAVIGVLFFVHSLSFLPQQSKVVQNNVIATRPCDIFQSCATDFTGDDRSPKSLADVDGQQVPVPDTDLGNPIQNRVLGATTDNKHIVVDLTTQTLYAYEGSTVVNRFTISSGKWNPTPTGHFTIWIKLYKTRMKGGSKAKGDYYDLPNIHYTMYFYNAQYPKTYGLSTHEAYWHNNFGHPMSHGCINMRLADAKWLYDWADPPTTGSVTKVTDDNPGTAVDIVGITP